MLNYSSIPELKIMAEALAQVLPEDHSPGDPQYLSRSALAICLGAKWPADTLLDAGIDCARRYWLGEASDEERVSVRLQVVARAETLRKQGQHFSPEWCKHGLVMWALEVDSPSTMYEVDYLLECALKAGISLEVIRKALEENVPGLTAILALKG